MVKASTDPAALSQGIVCPSRWVPSGLGTRLDLQALRFVPFASVRRTPTLVGFSYEGAQVSPGLVRGACCRTGDFADAFTLVRIGLPRRVGMTEETFSEIESNGAEGDVERQV